MFQYNPKSMKAQEFIHDGEIRETLAYAEANKNNLPLIQEILEKARPRKTEKGWHCEGLTHREASVLLACEDEEILKRIYEIAEEIKLAFYGNRIVIFAPPVSFQLLHQRLCLLPLPPAEQVHPQKKADPGRGSCRSYRPSGHGPQASGHRIRRRSQEQSH